MDWITIIGIAIGCSAGGAIGSAFDRAEKKWKLEASKEPPGPSGSKPKRGAEKPITQ